MILHTSVLITSNGCITQNWVKGLEYPIRTKHLSSPKDSCKDILFGHKKSEVVVIMFAKLRRDKTFY